MRAGGKMGGWEGAGRWESGRCVRRWGPDEQVGERGKVGGR